MTDLKKHNIISAATVSRLVKIAEHIERKREYDEQKRYRKRFEKENLCSRCSFIPEHRGCTEHRIVGGFYGVCTAFKEKEKNS